MYASMSHLKLDGETTIRVSTAGVAEDRIVLHLDEILYVSLTMDEARELMRKLESAIPVFVPAS